MKGENTAVGTELHFATRLRIAALLASRLFTRVRSFKLSKDVTFIVLERFTCFTNQVTNYVLW